MRSLPVPVYDRVEAYDSVDDISINFMTANTSTHLFKKILD